MTAKKREKTYTKEEVAAFLGIQPATLSVHVSRGKFPKGRNIKENGRVRMMWKESALLKFCDDQIKPIVDLRDKISGDKLSLVG